MQALSSRFWHRSWRGLLRHVVPHKENAYTPHLIEHHALLGYSVILVFLKVLLLVVAIILPSASVYSSAISMSNIAALTNASREALGIPPLSVSETLNEAATKKAQDMLQNAYFAHTSPFGVTPWSWFRDVGYAYEVAGENLAVHFSSAEDVHAGWLASPSHKKNILDPRFTEIGIGIARGEFESYDTTFVVELFAAPKEEEQVPPPIQAAAVIPEVPTPSSIEDRASVVPTESGYQISVVQAGAESVTAQLANASVPLVESAPSLWTGEVPVTQIASNTPQTSEPVYVVTTNTEGVTTVETIADTHPQAEAKEVFMPEGSSHEPQKFFGFFSVEQLTSLVGKVYVGILMLIGAMLLVTVCVKFHVQRHTILAHGLGVMVLGLLLWAL